jgi:hypothetical protein
MSDQEVHSPTPGNCAQEKPWPASKYHERQDGRPVGVLKMKPRYQWSMNESLQTVKLAITIDTREVSLGQLLAEACSRRIDLSLLVEAK